MSIDRRVHNRSGVMKPAQIGFVGATHGCILLDVSASGARVYLAPDIGVPEMVILRMSDGSDHAAVCRWQNGAEVGLEFLAL